MPSVMVKAADAVVKAKREATARRVIAEFGPLPDHKLLCFFDDVDWEGLKAGKATRGLYSPVDDHILKAAPDYLRDLLAVSTAGDSVQLRFDHVIYLQGSASSDEVGLAMTFAHELQHFIQRSNHRQIWPASSFILHIVRHFPVEISDALGLKTWSDIPHERDARIVAKRIVEGLFAEEDINRLIKKRLEFAVDDGDAADWQFINGISSSDVYDFCAATREIFQNLKPYKRDCERLLKRMVKVIPQLRDVDLDSLF